MNPKLLGFDIGGTKCAVILGHAEQGQVSIEDKVSFATPSGVEPALKEFETCAADLLDKHHCKSASVGVSCGGPLCSRRGLILSPPNLPGWDHVPIVKRFSAYFQVPVFLQNDANACALAEWKWGAGRGFSNVVFLTFGTGMGAGLILDGKLYAGTCDLAGEVGHVRLAEEGPEGYGKAGSFEGFCSGGGIARLARSNGLPVTNAHEVFLAAEQGNHTAVDTLKTVSFYLGRGLAMLIDILNPEVIVLGSIFARQRDRLWPLAEVVMRKEAIGLAMQACQVVPAKLGENIGDYAALSVATLVDA
jgi:glucokinase